MKRLQKNKAIIWLFSKVYSKWLWYQKWEDYPPEKREVMAVLGWRTMRIKEGYRVQTITPCFLWFN